jgi:hypothetical protein
MYYSKAIKDRTPMSKSIFILPLFLLFISHGLPAFADPNYECRSSCSQIADSCFEQARLNAGNIQEQQDAISACRDAKGDCIRACRVPDDVPAPPPAEQTQQEPPPREQPPVDSNGEIKTYEFK